MNQNFKNIKIICTDLDGTLLHSDKTVSKYTLDILKKAAAQNYIIVPVTGRHLGGIPESITEQNIKYAICSNGAGIYDFTAKKILKEEKIPDSIMLKLLDDFIELDIMADIFTSDNAFTDPRNLDILKDVDASEPVKNYIRNSRIIKNSIKDFYTDERPAVQKLTINFRKQGNIYKGKNEIIQILSQYESLVYVTGGANNIEITNKYATKGKCIEYLSEITGVSVSDIIAFGDTENDISMLKTAGISVAMKNADSELIDIADYITEYDNDHDGAASFIEKYLLD